MMRLAAMALVASLSIYPSTMVVTNISGDVVTMETATGHQYEMVGADDWMVGDMVAAIMDDNGTEDVTDDAIVMAHYVGTADDYRK